MCLCFPRVLREGIAFANVWTRGGSSHRGAVLLAWLMALQLSQSSPQSGFSRVLSPFCLVSSGILSSKLKSSEKGAAPSPCLLLHVPYTYAYGNLLWGKGRGWGGCVVSLHDLKSQGKCCMGSVTRCTCYMSTVCEGRHIICLFLYWVGGGRGERKTDWFYLGIFNLFADTVLLICIFLTLLPLAQAVLFLPCYCIVTLTAYSGDLF